MFEPQAFVSSLTWLWRGMLGVLAVIAVIILLTLLLTHLFRPKK